MPPARSRDWEKITLLVFGSFFFIVLLTIAYINKEEPNPKQWCIYLWVLAMAAGGVAAMLPGAVNLQLPAGIRAAGAVALAVLVFWYGKDVSTTARKDVAAAGGIGATVVKGLSSNLIFPKREGKPSSTDIYVLIDSRIVAEKIGTSKKPLFHVNRKYEPGSINIREGSGGFVIDYAAVEQGKIITVMAKDNKGQWWLSHDMKVPEQELGMRTSTEDEVTNRVDDIDK